MYPIKYLNEFFVPNGSYLETNILLTSVSDKYRNLSEEEKNKKREYGREGHRSMFKEKKQELKNIKKITVRLKSLNLIISKIVFNHNFIVYTVV